MRSDSAGVLERPRARPGETAAVPIAAALIAAALLTMFVAAPLAAVLVAGTARASAFFAQARPLLALSGSLAVAALSAVLTVALGSVVAYAVTRADIPGKEVVSAVIRLPMVTPPFVAALALLLLLGDGGLLARTIGVRLDVRGFTGIVIAQVVTFVPYAFLVMADVFRKSDGTLEEAAENLGSSRLDVLRRVTLAPAAPGLASSLLVVFVLALSDFANPFLIGGDFPVLATDMYARAIGGRDAGGAAALGIALLAPCLVAYLLNTYWLGIPPALFRWEPSVGTGRGMTPLIRWPLFALAGGGALCVLGLYAGVALSSFAGIPEAGLRVSLRHYRALLGPEGIGPLLQSLRLAALAAGAGTLLALMIAYVTTRRPVPGAGVIQVWSGLPSALPGPVFGLGYLLAFGAPPVPLAGTVWILVAGIVFWKLPLGVLTAVAFLGRVDPAREEAAVSLGAGRVRVFTQVTLPYLVPIALLAFAEFFVDSLVTVNALVMLVSAGVAPGSVAMLQGARAGALGWASALAVLLFVPAAGAVLLRRRAAGVPAIRGAS